MEEERRRREEAERRLLDETAHRQRLVEEEVKMREKHFSQVSGAAGGDGRRREERGGEGKKEGREEGTPDLGERMRGETLKRGWVCGKIKDPEGREKNRGRGKTGGEFERTNREENAQKSNMLIHKVLILTESI